MSNGTTYWGKLDLIDYYLFKDDAKYQPVAHYPVTTPYQISGVVYNTSALESNYPTVPEATVIPDLETGGQYSNLALERTFWGIYVLGDGIGGGYHYAYHGTASEYKVAEGSYPPSFPSLQIGNSYYGWRWIHIYVSKFHLVQYKEYKFFKRPKPYYADLVGGYSHDVRILPPPFAEILPIKTENITIGYYKNNHAEPIADLLSIDWVQYDYKLEKNIKICLNLENCVLGTLYLLKGTNQLFDLLSALPVPSSSYSYLDYFPVSIANLFSTWNTIYEDFQIELPDNFTVSRTKKYVEVDRQLNQLGATNDYWENGISSISNINADRFLADDITAYRWHIEEQPDDKGLGNLIMDSPRTIEIHKALDAGNYSLNKIHPDEPRISSLGHYIERIAALLGYRVDDDGLVDVKKEKKEYVRRIIKSDSKPDETKYGGNGFAEKGMYVRRLTNHFDKKQIKEGGVVAIHDYSQLMLEVLDQLNLALGIQESGAIEIHNGNEKYKYPNQLALLTDIFIHQVNQSKYIKSSYLSSIVTQEQTKEIIGGLGLPTVSKSIKLKVNGKGGAVPYWGIAPQASIARKIDTCSYNVGIVLGQLL